MKSDVIWGGEDNGTVYFAARASETDDFFVKTDGSKSAIVVDAQREYIAFMSGGTGDVPEAANPRTMTDVNFLVSGSIGGKGSANRGVAVFNGDAVISGTLYPGGNTDQFISSDGTEIIIDGNDHVDIRIDESFGVYTAAGGTSKPILGVFNNDGTEGRGTVINTNGLSYLDFRVESDNKLGSILVDGGTEQVVSVAAATVWCGTRALCRGEAGCEHSDPRAQRHPPAAQRPARGIQGDTLNLQLPGVFIIMRLLP